jgi:uncharacterized protein YjbI with pentapeptide repeats
MQSSPHVIVVAMAEGKKPRTEIKAPKAAGRNPRLTTVLLLVGIVISIGVAVAVGYLFDSRLVIRIIRVIAIILAVVFFMAFLYRLIRLGYRYEWTGFGEADLPKPENREVRPKKTVWDWMQLLIVPLVLALATVAFTLYQDSRQNLIEERRAARDRQIEEQRAASERKTAEQRAQDAALQAYLDQMGSLLLEKDLRESKEDSEVRTLARARTLTVLGRLDPSRKTAVMQFLVDADLVQSIDERDPIVSLNGADLSGANVNDANLRNADLNGADLSDANLSDSDLRDADLSLAALANADLSFADLSDADLSDAYLRGAYLRGAYLRGANLSFANLSDADLSDAYLFGADLSGVDLSVTKVFAGAADEAILTFRQCIEAEAGASVGPLEERIYEIKPQIPEEIRLGETERAGLLVSPLTINEIDESDPGCVEPADRMKAQLVPYDLEGLGTRGYQPDIQELSWNRVTRWGWDITARQTGNLELLLDLRYSISPEGQEFRLVPQSPVYEGPIRVTTERPSP